MISQENNIVFIEDTSANGTFVDGDIIGNGKKIPLANNAEISLAGQGHKGKMLKQHYATICHLWCVFFMSM